MTAGIGALVIFVVVLAVGLYAVHMASRPTGDDIVRANRQNCAKVSNMRRNDNRWR